MSHEEQLPEELMELERALRSFEPAPSRIDRDRLMFDAGAACGVARLTAASEPRHSELSCEPRRAVGHGRSSIGSRLGGRRLDRRRLNGGRLWRLSTVAAALVACLFATLYVAERSRPPVVVREVVTVERSEQPAVPLAANTIETAPRLSSTRRESAGTEYSVPSTRYLVPGPGTQYSTLTLPFWPFSILRPPATSHEPPTTYFALRQLVLTRGIDALPRREDASDVDLPSEPLRPPSTIRELMKEFLPPPVTDVSTEADQAWLPESTALEIGETI